MMRKQTPRVTLLLSAVTFSANALYAAPLPKKTSAVPAAKATAAPVLTENQRILQALNRLGYGPRPGDMARVRKMGLAAYLNQQLAPEARGTRLDGFLHLVHPLGVVVDKLLKFVQHQKGAGHSLTRAARRLNNLGKGVHELFVAHVLHVGELVLEQLEQLGGRFGQTGPHGQ